MDQRTRVHLEYACPICGDEYMGARYLVDHMEDRHQISLPPRQLRARRPKSKQYNYQDYRSSAAIIHHACPSCWEHFPPGDLGRLRQHMVQHLEDQRLVDAFNYKAQLEDEEQEEQEEQQEEGEMESSGAEEETPHIGNQEPSSFEDDHADNVSGLYTRLTDLVDTFKHLFKDTLVAQKDAPDTEAAHGNIRSSTRSKRGVSVSFDSDEEEEYR